MRAKPKRVVFAEGEEECVIRAAAAFQNSGLGKALLVGRADIVAPGFHAISGIGREMRSKSACRIRHKKPRPISTRFTTACSGAACSIATAVRMVTNDRNIYAASMLAAGDADAMVTGVTRNYAAALTDVRTVLRSLAWRCGPSACR